MSKSALKKRKKEVSNTSAVTSIHLRAVTLLREMHDTPAVRFYTCITFLKIFGRHRATPNGLTNIISKI